MADRICDNCMSKVPIGTEKCPQCGIRFENTNPGGALPNGWVLGGRYTVGRYIDIDGEGVTYSAIDGDTLQRVTLKEFMPVTLCAARDEDGSIRPKPGCEVLFKTTRLDYTELYVSIMRLGPVEGLLQVLDVLEENNSAYAVLEKVEGPTLAEYLTKRDSPVDAARALALLRPVMSGVELMHSNNLIHGGISPDNIVLESGGSAKLGGFATQALRQQGSELKPKLFPGYSAPEQYSASEFVGLYTDIYALGAVFYRLVTKAEPFPADERRLQDTLRPARALNKEIPNFLSSAIARSMRVLPVERIQTLAELRMALSGEEPRGGSGPLGLTRQQTIVGIAAASTIVVLLLVVLLISALSGGKKDASESSSIPSSSSLSSSVVENEDVPDFVGKKVDDVLKNTYYTERFKFAEPEEVYDADVEAGRIISQTPKSGTQWDGTTPIKLVVSKGIEPVPLPSLANLSQGDAVTKLKELNLTYEIRTETNPGNVAEGIVLRTDPVAGTAVQPGKDKIIVFVAGKVASISMPELRGRAHGEAETELNNLNLRFEVVLVDNNVSVNANGTVQSTNPAAGVQVARDSTVIQMYVYRNFIMPNISGFVGRDLTELYNYLESVGVPYTSPPSLPEVVTNDPNLNGKVAIVNHTPGAEMTKSSPPITIALYKYVAPASPAP